MSDFMVAFRFLTIIPLGKEKVFAPDRVKGSLNYYSVVGLVLGCALGSVSGTSALRWVVGECNHCCFSCPSYGRPHLDGLADTADAIFSSKPREENCGL